MKLDRVARVFLWAGFGMMLTFHALPIIETNLRSGESDFDWGYEIWWELYQVAMNPGSLDAADWVSVSGFLLALACAAAAPFTVRMLKGSRLMWWAFVLGVAISAIGFTVVVGDSLVTNYGSDDDSRVRVGAIAFLSFPYLTLVGLLCLRGKNQPAWVSR